MSRMRVGKASWSDESKLPDKVLLYGTEGIGKTFSVSEPIMMSDGSVRVAGDIKVGDQLMGPDSAPRTVVETHRGRGRLFRVEMNKGGSYVCNEHHEMLVYDHYTGSTHTVTPLEWMRLKQWRRQNIMHFRVPLEFPDREVPYDPYFVGVYLGDGTKNSSSPQITNGDEEVLASVSSFAESNGLKASTRPSRGSSRVGISTGGGNTANPLLNFVREELLTGSNERRIPENYILNSRQKRLELLAGLIDTDGCLMGNCYEISCKDKAFADQIQFLCRTLGFQCTMRAKKGVIRSIGFTGTYWRMFISGDINLVPVRVERRKALPRKQRKDVLRVGFSVREIEPGEFAGFQLDGDHLHVLPDCIVAHNSTFGSDARDPIFLASEDGLRKLERRVKMFPMPTSFTEALEAIEAAITEDHDHKTFVIDTVDWLEVLLWSELCSRNNWKSIESPGYGKGYVAASEWWNKLFEALDRLRSTRGMEVVLLAHAHVKSFNPPHLDTSYDRFEIALHKNAASKVKQWVDYVLFMYYQERFDKEKGRVRAEGSHVIYTHRRPAFDAKWRGNVKDVIPGTYADFDAHRRASGIDINALRSESVELIEALEPDDELRAKIDKGLAAAGASEVKWAQCVERLRFLLTEKEENSDDGTSRAASGESGLVEAHQVQ